MKLHLTSLLLVLSSLGHSMTGSELLMMCADAKNVESGQVSHGFPQGLAQGSCYAYIQGVRDMVDVSSPGSLCVPESVSVTHLSAMVLGLLMEAPESHLEAPASIQVIGVLKGKYSCT